MSFPRMADGGLGDSPHQKVNLLHRKFVSPSNITLWKDLERKWMSIEREEVSTKPIEDKY
jgi:hypothetical protein